MVFLADTYDQIQASPQARLGAELYSEYQSKGLQPDSYPLLSGEDFYALGNETLLSWFLIFL